MFCHINGLSDYSECGFLSFLFLLALWSDLLYFFCRSEEVLRLAK